MSSYLVYAPSVVASLLFVTSIMSQTVEILVGQMRTLLELCGAVFLFIWCGNDVPTPHFLALHPWLAEYHVN